MPEIYIPILPEGTKIMSSKHSVLRQFGYIPQNSSVKGIYCTHMVSTYSQLVNLTHFIGGNMSIKNAVYAQSGGVTAVINASACGVIQAAETLPPSNWDRVRR